jgi:hypothetical protein
MDYAGHVLEMLLQFRTWFVGIAGVLLLEGLVLAFFSRRYQSASSFLRVLLVITLALALSAGVLAGLTEWQIRTLDPHIPFIHLPDGGIQYVVSPVVGVTCQAIPLITLGAALVLLLGMGVGGVALVQRVVRFLTSGLRKRR